MTPFLIGVAGLVAVVAGGLVLHTFGAAYRIGRLLAVAPIVTIAEANAIAESGRRAYVRIAGRIDAEDEFEDADHRPLVFRRVRLEARIGRSWRPFEDHRQSVPFVVNEGLDSIAIDVDALDAGLIVLPRESVGRAADLPDRVPDEHPADTPVRARIEQISSVEHAIVVGFPVAVPGPSASASVSAAGVSNATPTPDAGVETPPSGAAGSAPGAITAQMTAGRGRPLILTVLEPPEAMRILAGGDAGRTRLAAGLLGAGAILIAGALVWAGVTALLPAIVTAIPGASHIVASALAASAEPSLAAGGGDPRSNGQGPGLVGTPALAILGVVAIAIGAIVLTTIYVRLTTPRAAGRPDPEARRRDPGAGRTRRH